MEATILREGNPYDILFVKNIPYGMVNRLRSFWSSGHLVIFHPVIQSSRHPVKVSYCHAVITIFNIDTNPEIYEQHYDLQVCFADNYRANHY